MVWTRVTRRVAVVVVAVAALAPCAAARADAPLNDNYLRSTTMLDPAGNFPTNWSDTQDVATATTQGDLFSFDKQGFPFGGGPPENTHCGSAFFANTVWYDFHPPLSGAVELKASGYDTVIAVYEYDVETARIVKTLKCLNESAGTAEDLALPTGVQNGHAYTVQVGRVVTSDPTQTKLSFSFHFFADRDGDEVLDAEPDRCLEVPGIEPSGCPPQLNAAPHWAWEPAGSGIRLSTLTVSGVPSGGRVEARCGRCKLRQVVRAKPGQSVVRLARFIGPALPRGATVEFRVTRPAGKTGRYRFGAVGNYVKFTVTAKGLAQRRDRCLMPDSKVPKQRCV
jgi:hypothetical protein